MKTTKLTVNKMRLKLIFISGVILPALFSIQSEAQIIADHTIVADYQYIPQQYIDSVKKMWFVLAGESHSAGYRVGLNALESIDAKYAVHTVDNGTPEAYTNINLRASRATWGDVYNETGWIYSYGEEDWFSTTAAINRTKAGITYCNTNNLEIAAMGFGWCWDPGIKDFNKYVNATRSYINYCDSAGYPTKVFFTTGTVDADFSSYSDSVAYIKHCGYELIRDSVKAHPTWILFDYADILCWNDDGSDSTTSWKGHIFPIGTAENTVPINVSGHINSKGALRIGKAVWWMLARMAGWDGIPNVPDTITPTTPTNLQGEGISTTSIFLTWNNSTDNRGVTGYIVYRNNVAIDTVSAPSFTDTGLSINTDYFYKVAAIDQAGNKSNNSSQITVSTLEVADTQAPTVPANLQANVLSQSSISLTWTASTDNVIVMGYIIYRDDIIVDTVASDSYIDADLTPGTSYTYQVSAIDGSGNQSELSDSVTAITQDVNSIIDLFVLTEKQIDIFPNPSDGLVNLKFKLESKKTVNVIVYNTIGQVQFESGVMMIESGFSQITVNLTDLREGIYICKLLIGDQQIIKKLQIVK